MDANEALSSLGNFGKFQIFLYSITSFLSCFIGSWHMLAIVFIGQEPNYHCAVDETKPLNESIPYDELNANIFDKCKMYNENGSKVACESYWFGPEIHSIVNEWNLTCDRSYLVDLSQTILVVGVLIGAILCSNLSDRFGRKIIFLSSVLCISLLGVIASQMPNMWSLFLVRFLIGIFQQGVILTGFVYLCEIFPATKRTMPGILMQVIWAIAMCCLALLGYLLRNWRHLMLAVSVPFFLVLPLFYFLPESLPWLIAKKKYKLAAEYLRKGARINGIAEEKIKRFIDSCSKNNDGTTTTTTTTTITNNNTTNNNRQQRIDESANYTILDILKAKRLRYYCLIMAYIWCVNTLVYYGLSLSTASLAGDPYLNFFLSGLVETPAYFVACFALLYCGRRWPIFIFHSIAGIALLTTAFMPKEVNGYNLVPFIVSLSMIGKFGITGSFASVFLWAPEIMPTTVRNQGIGLASLGGRVGNLIAPFSSSLAKKITWLPAFIFGVMSIIAAIFTLLLPETLNRALPQTIEEVEKWTRTLSDEEKAKIKAEKSNSKEMSVLVD